MFRFTIRELLLLTVITGVGAGWWVDRAALTRRSSSVQSELDETKKSYEVSKQVNRVLIDFLNARGYRESGFPDEAFAPKK